MATGKWKNPLTEKENIGDNDEPLHFQGLDGEEESPVDGVIPTCEDQRVSGVVEKGPPGVGGSVPPKGGEGSQEQGDAQEPRRSSRENRGVPPLRFIEILEVAAEAANGGALATYEST